MNKKSITITILLASFLLTGCSCSALSRNSGQHKTTAHAHKYEKEWSYNNAYHYHKCSITGCSETNGNEEHNLIRDGSDYKCDVCGYVQSSSHTDYIGTASGHYPIINGNKGDFEEHNLIPFDGDGRHVPIEPTCEKPGKNFMKCTMCNRIVDNVVDPTGHVLQKVDSTEGNPTCTENGYVDYECVKCGKIEREDVPALGHNLKETYTGIEGVSKIVCSRSSCDATVIALDISGATGWNKADQKMNGKTSPDNQSTWNVEGVIEDGTYDIYVIGYLSDSSHGNRKWYNMSMFDLITDGDLDANNTNGQPDKNSDDSYRYFFKINDSTVINPNVKDNWAELGFKSQKNGEDPAYGAICRDVNIYGASTFSLIHGKIGYALIISGVYLVKYTM